MPFRKKNLVSIDVFYPTGKKEKLKVETDKNKLLIEEAWTPTFKPSDFFKERHGFLKRTRRFLMIGYLMTKTISWDETEPEESNESVEVGEKKTVKVDDFQLYWTPKEQRELIKKEIAKAKSKMRPISITMFLALMGFSLLTLLLVIAIAMRMGVFA